MVKAQDASFDNPRKSLSEPVLYKFITIRDKLFSKTSNFYATRILEWDANNDYIGKLLIFCTPCAQWCIYAPFILYQIKGLNTHFSSFQRMTTQINSKSVRELFLFQPMRITMPLIKTSKFVIIFLSKK